MLKINLTARNWVGDVKNGARNDVISSPKQNCNHQRWYSNLSAQQFLYKSCFLSSSVLSRGDEKEIKNQACTTFGKPLAFPFSICTHLPQHTTNTTHRPWSRHVAAIRSARTHHPLSDVTWNSCQWDGHHRSGHADWHEPALVSPPGPPAVSSWQGRLQTDD